MPAPAASPSTAPTSRVVFGAAAVGGIAAGFLLGPIVGIAGAAGAAYAASADKGFTGNAARTVGSTAATAASSAHELNRQHQITSRAAAFIRAGTAKAQQLGEEWKVGEKLHATARRASEFEQEHQLGGRAAAGASRAAKGLSDGLIAATRALRKLPPGWSVRTDQATQREYYINEHTGESQWEFPSNPAPTQPRAPQGGSGAKALNLD